MPGGEFAKAVREAVGLIPSLWKNVLGGCPGLKQALCIYSIGSWYPASPPVETGSLGCREGLIILNILHSTDVP